MANKKKALGKKAIWWTIGAVAAIAIVLIIALNGGNDSPGIQGGVELPSVDEADYSALQSSGDDFAALDEAANLLE